MISGLRPTFITYQRIYHSPSRDNCKLYLSAFTLSSDESVTIDGDTYFVNHKERKTQWEDPRQDKLVNEIFLCNVVYDSLLDLCGLNWMENCVRELNNLVHFCSLLTCDHWQENNFWQVLYGNYRLS